jgi:IS30 family transposase
MRLAHETIYQAIYHPGQRWQRREQTAALRTRRTRRKPRRRADRRTTRFCDPMVMIADRPAISDRSIPGHCEGDLITGTENRSAIGTLVERWASPANVDTQFMRLLVSLRKNNHIRRGCNSQ